jgi:thioredoxin-related protein
MKIIRLAFLHTTILVAIFLSPNRILAQTEPLPAINWLTFKQVKLLNAEKPKPIMVFFYKADDDTSQLMLKTTFTNKKVSVYTNAKFYAVKLDVNSKADITFMDGKVYKRDPAKPYHDLVLKLLGENPQVPTVLLYDDLNNGFSFKGYKNYYDMLSMLVYISENVQKTTKYEKWAPAYFHTFPPDQKVNNIPLAVNWLPLKEALTLNKEKPKGIFLTFYTKSNASSAVMLANAFSHNKVAGYFNDNFYNVRLDAQTTDTLIWDKKYVNKHEAGNFNELATTMLKGKMQFPAIFYFDKSNKLILNESSYLSPEALYLLSNYVVSESFKTEPFAEFIKNFKFEFNDIVPREFKNTDPAVKPE